MKKTGLITGASSGIGYAAATLFASKGWNVIAAMRSPEKVAGLAEDDVLVTRLDVQNRDTIDQAIKDGRPSYGQAEGSMKARSFGWALWSISGVLIVAGGTACPK